MMSFHGLTGHWYISLEKCLQVLCPFLKGVVWILLLLNSLGLLHEDNKILEIIIFFKLLGGLVVKNPPAKPETWVQSLG